MTGYEMCLKLQFDECTARIIVFNNKQATIIDRIVHIFVEPRFENVYHKLGTTDSYRSLLLVVNNAR